MLEEAKIILPAIQKAGEVVSEIAGAKDNGSVFFIGTATTLIRRKGFTILTDPNFLHAGEHADLGYGLKSERLTNPAIEIAQLPDIDLCVLSHMHGDHWDHHAAEKLPKDLPIVTTEQAVKELNEQGFTNVYPLKTWESIVARRDDQWLRITAMPGKHGPPLVAMALPDVNGNMLEWGDGWGEPDFRLYISGDTLIIDDLAEIPQRYPNIDLALLHLGGTKVMGVLVTMDAEQGIKMLRIIQPTGAIPIHFNDYTVFESPLEDFIRLVEKAGLQAQVHYLRHGESFEFSQL